MKLNNREVEILEVAGIDLSDHPDFSDAYVESARFSDTGEALSEPELLKLAALYPAELSILFSDEAINRVAAQQDYSESVLH